METMKPEITLPPREAMSLGAQKMRDFYAHKPDAPVYQQEFGFYVLDRWKAEGHIGADAAESNLGGLFGYDPPGKYFLGNLGWCEAGFTPLFEEKVLEDQGNYELVQDFAGRGVKYFRGRRNGFMPEYVDHPVKDQKSWEEKCLWRMDPTNPDRLPAIQKTLAEAKTAAAEGQIICANLVGGYMYLRSLIGPVELLYLFYDDPRLIHRCMEAWFRLADTVYARMQEEIVFDEVFIGEDICYNHGLLISSDMIREFLFPYYQQLLSNVKGRQRDKTRTLHFQVDTDGFSDAAISLYRELGMDYLSPFEAASGCDVIRTAGEYPGLLIRGGFDKRILAAGKDAIDREVDRIMPVMKKRGGYIPTCDHGVPEEVSFENYLHYRRRMLEFA
ncbi:MAG: uroporphyrinogen decarboxylase family protein [Spirochaetaceae bacterium]|jgi:uroporphyrinogen decarboxylase|nr:uroporphyrinogen decarboxylase family protein [Spirochaetaceae bacterium]